MQKVPADLFEIRVFRCNLADVSKWMLFRGDYGRNDRMLMLRTALLALILQFLALPAGAEGPIVIKFSHVVAADTPKGKASEFSKRRAEELTRGRVKVEAGAAGAHYLDATDAAIQSRGVSSRCPSPSRMARQSHANRS